MHRLVIITLALSASTAGMAQAEIRGDRYGPSRPILRGAENLASAQGAPRLLTWAGKDVGLRGRTPMATAPASAPVRAARLAPQPQPQPWPQPRPDAPAVRQGSPTPPPAEVAAYPQPWGPMQAASAARPTVRQYGQTEGHSTAKPGSYDPQQPRRYSVGREFGVQPDPIAMPDPTVLAFSPEVGAAFAAQNERQGLDDGALSPADRDQIEQASQDDDRRESRQKARDKAAAAKK